MQLGHSEEKHELEITWARGKAQTTLTANLETKEWEIRYRCLESGDMKVLDVPHLEAQDPACQAACATKWSNDAP